MIKDRFISVHYIHDDSMQPVLQKGDFVLVRRVDLFPNYSIGGSTIATGHNDDDDDGDDHQENTNEGGKNTNSSPKSPINQDEIDRLNSQTIRSQFRGKFTTPIYDTVYTIPFTRIVAGASPPYSLPGQVILFENPSRFHPPDIQAKRLIAMGGQKVLEN